MVKSKSKVLCKSQCGWDTKIKINETNETTKEEGRWNEDTAVKASDSLLDHRHMDNLSRIASLANSLLAPAPPQILDTGPLERRPHTPSCWCRRARLASRQSPWHGNNNTKTSQRLDARTLKGARAEVRWGDRGVERVPECAIGGGGSGGVARHRVVIDGGSRRV